MPQVKGILRGLMTSQWRNVHNTRVVSPANQTRENTNCITYLVVFGLANGLLLARHQAITLIAVYNTTSHCQYHLAKEILC